jgi:hypothetical protein
MSEDKYEVRDLRDQPWCWQHKSVLRLIRKYWDGPKARNLKDVYVAVTEAASNKGRDENLLVSLDTLCELACMSRAVTVEALEILDACKFLLVEKRRSGLGRNLTNGISLCKTPDEEELKSVISGLNSNQKSSSDSNQKSGSDSNLDQVRIQTPLGEEKKTGLEELQERTTDTPPSPPDLERKMRTGKEVLEENLKALSTQTWKIFKMTHFAIMGFNPNEPTRGSSALAMVAKAIQRVEELAMSNDELYLLCLKFVTHFKDDPDRSKLWLSNMAYHIDLYRPSKEQVEARKKKKENFVVEAKKAYYKIWDPRHPNYSDGRDNATFKDVWEKLENGGQPWVAPADYETTAILREGSGDE